jgi:amidase
VLTEDRVSAEILAAVFVAQLPMWVSMDSSEYPKSFKIPNTDIARPTQKRISTLGSRAPMAGRETIGGCPGPMAVDRDALEIFMKVALSAKPWRVDPALTAKEWTPYSFTTRPKIAIQWWDGVVKPHPPMLRALREVAESCRQAGMEVVDWDCEHLDHQKSWDIVSALYWPDGAKEVLDLIEQSGEPVLPLTKWITQEQPSAKELSQHELWKVS